MLTIADELKAAKHRLGLTVREMAVAVNSDQSLMSQWLNGHVNPGPEYRDRFWRSAKWMNAEQAHAPFKVAA